MKIWTSEQVKRSKSYGRREIVVLAAECIGSLVVLAGLFIFLKIKGWNDESGASIMVMAFVTAALFLFVGIRSKRGNCALIFCRDDAWRMFALNVEDLVKQRHTFLGTADQKVDVSQKLAQLKREHTLERLMSGPTSLRPYAPEILEVLRMRQRGDCWKLFCKVRMPNGKEDIYPYSIWHGYDDESSLLNELERRRPLMEDGTVKPYGIYWVGLILSFLALALEWVLLFLSMPAVAILPYWAFECCIFTYIIPLIAAVYFWNHW